MAIAPLQPHSSSYRRFWYADRSPLDALVDRTLTFAIIALALLAGATLLLGRDGGQRAATGTTFTEITH
jgi:hypothetical protein